MFFHLGVFNDTDSNPVAVYGGPKDAGFTWQMLADGTVMSDSATDVIVALTRGAADSCKLPWEDEVGTSTPTTYLGMDEYWFVDLYHNVADYALFHASKSHACIIRACFAF